MSFVAISKVEYPADMQDIIQKVGLEMLPIARSMRGFISIAFHTSLEKKETMMYWEWESKSDHEACMDSPAWKAIMEKSASVFRADGIKFTIETYERLS